jgi:hypothetical protein
VEVHAAPGPLGTLREFMLHLLAMAIGMLLALGLEASVEWSHHRSLVREAEENIVREIGDNQKGLALELASLPVEKAQLEEILTIVSDLQNGRSATPLPSMHWATIRLSASSWSTSAASGATTHMGYAEVKRYSLLYASQDTYNALMDRYLGLRLEMFGALERLNLPDRPSGAEFESMRRAVTQQLVIGQGLREIGGMLGKEYASMEPVK